MKVLITETELKEIQGTKSKESPKGNMKQTYLRAKKRNLEHGGLTIEQPE